MKLSEIVLSIPHASTAIPPEIRTWIPHDDAVLNHEPDLYTDRVYRMKDVRTVAATVSRIISDVNRAPDEIYTVGRNRAGGVVMLSLSNGPDVFEVDPSVDQMAEWIHTHHLPFHAALDEALIGAKFLIDCHSMHALAPKSAKNAGTPRPDIVLGNRLFTTCDAQTTKFFRDVLRKRGFTVAINDPFIGRYVVGTHCSRKSTPGLQIEINRKLYMDEQSLEPHEVDIENLNKHFTEIIQEFCAWDDARTPEILLTDLSIDEDEDLSNAGTEG